MAAGNFEALTAAEVLADHYVVAANHVRAKLGEAGTVAVVGPRGYGLLFGADQPVDFVVIALVAVRTVEGCHFLVGTFVEKFALFHGGLEGEEPRNKIVTSASVRHPLDYGTGEGWEKKTGSIGTGVIRRWPRRNRG